MTRIATWGFVAVLVGCGGSRGGGGGDRCAAGQHLANPDGRGDRCIEDSSACEHASDCAGDGACCDGACADPHGSGVYECVQNCHAPECTEGSCAVDLVCDVIDACTAHCVPEGLECDPGTVPADPTGSGVFSCIPEDSACFAAGDCAAVGLVDPCCPPICAADLDGRYVCSTACAGAGAEDPGFAAPAPECTGDQDCVANYGEGWTCAQGCGGSAYCVAPPDPCQCAVGAYVAVCGADGQTYDAACGDECVPVEIACRNECPCDPA